MISVWSWPCATCGAVERTAALPSHARQASPGIVIRYKNDGLRPDESCLHFGRLPARSGDPGLGEPTFISVPTTLNHEPGFAIIAATASTHSPYNGGRVGFGPGSYPLTWDPRFAATFSFTYRAS